MLHQLTSHGIMSGGDPLHYARGLLRRSDAHLARELKSVRAAEVSASAFMFGLWQGMHKAQGGHTIAYLPTDLVAGIGLHVAGLFSGKYGHHLHAFADGALASFATTAGYRVGERAKDGGFMKGLSGMFGDVGAAPTGGASISDKELDSLVRAE